MDHPFWAGNENKGQLRRIGFGATARLERHEFGVSWQDVIPKGGVVVGNQIDVMLDVEAVLLADLERTGAIEYYEVGHRRLRCEPASAIQADAFQCSLPTPEARTIKIAVRHDDLNGDCRRYQSSQEEPS
jgi:hypothetical protein